MRTWEVLAGGSVTSGGTVQVLSQFLIQKQIMLENAAGRFLAYFPGKFLVVRISHVSDTR